MASFATPFRVLWRRRALERTNTWAPDRLARHQQQKLAELRRWAVQRSPFYQRFHSGLDQRPLQALPVLTKALMMEHFDTLITDRRVRLADADAFLRTERSGGLFLNRYVVLSTSGSTGRRGVFLFDPDEWLTALAMITRPIAWAHVRTGSRRPRSAMIASTTPWHYSTHVSRALSTRLLPALRLDASEPMASMVSQLNAWQPQVLAAYPSVLRQLAAEQLAGRLQIHLRSIATSAEVLPAETRRQVHAAWGVRVYDTYGATEYAPIAAECDRGRKHLLDDGAIIEVVDETGRPVPAGRTGDRILLTVFDRRTQPLIRYEISDMVKPGDGQCECGRPFRLIDSIEGRVEDVLEFPGVGTLKVAVHPTVFHELLETVPVDGWQIEQTAQGVTVRLSGLREPCAVEGLAARIRVAIEAQGARVGSITVRTDQPLVRGATGKAPLIAATGKAPLIAVGRT